jgi:hypothetical protein
MAGYYGQVVDILKDHGCWFVRNGKGDHEIWHSPITDRNITVDVGCKSRHTANEVMKQAGIDHKF